VGAATLKLYHERLCKFDVERISAAMDICIDQYDHFPSVPQLKSAIASLPAPRLGLLEEPRPSPEQVAEAKRQLSELIESCKPAPRATEMTVAERKALLIQQAAQINAAEKES